MTASKNAEAKAAKTGDLAASVDRGYAPGRATRELLIRTAERLFAEWGINAVSLREIGQAAGQRNNAAIEYHFGSRDHLLAAVYASRATWLNARRLQLLQDLRDEGKFEDVGSLVRVALAPHVESLGNPNDHFVEFLARVLTEQARLYAVPLSPVAPDMDALVTIRDQLSRCLPALGDDCVGRRFSTIFNWAIHRLAEFSRDHPGATRRDVEDMFDELVSMLQGALRAGTED
jgi:AcrR family transcriptional regulator